MESIYWEKATIELLLTEVWGNYHVNIGSLDSTLVLP